ncbi:alkaline phosphatase-like isoform X2 [Ostrea edulis]|uniref:alkaline phosphatase-like isoform X2 n=1 Tax=Ostrea edulis TaxID=37623 RepID=UPI002095A7E6|nr:alkaline phosphatase-like isoform X2 [Ostrea edulis]
MSVFSNLILVLFFTCYVKSDTPWGDIAQSELDESLRITPNTNVAKNIILFLGDGMSISTVTASRILQGRQKGELGEANYLAFEKFPNSALIKTYCNDRTTPDSAATATAFLCGVKTNYHTLGVKDKAVLGNCSSQFGNEVESILDWFHADGRSTGIVSTSRITHATPGAGYAHVADRDWEGDSEMEGVTGGCKDVAYQLIKENTHIKVLFGGGRYYFLKNTTDDPKYGAKNVDKQRRDGLDLIKEWQKEKRNRNLRASYAWNRQQLLNIDPVNTDVALGLFNDGHMNFELDRDNSSSGEPSISEMTQKAVQILRKNPKGFFLLVEGGRIDSAHHDNNAKRALYDTLAFEKAIRGALELVNDKNTLVLVTADHSQPLIIAGYASRHNSLFGYVDRVKTKHIPKEGVLWTTLLYGIGPGYDWGNRSNKTMEQLESKDYIQAAASPRDSSTHDGQDVAIYARGPMSHLFRGVHEQHYINYVMTYASCVGRHKNNCMSESRLTSAGSVNEKSLSLLVVITYMYVF